MPDGFRLEWHGEGLKRIVEANAAQIIAEFGLTVEGEAKKELRKKHGVLTGTLRRSIHTALPGYNWDDDNVEPKKQRRKRNAEKKLEVVSGTPERGGQLVIPATTGGQIKIEVGSGMSYAMAVHQGHQSFSGYHYLTNGLSRAKRKLNSIINRHKVVK